MSGHHMEDHEDQDAAQQHGHHPQQQTLTEYCDQLLSA